MFWIVILALVLIFVFVLMGVIAARISRNKSALYFKNSHLFSPAERSFLGVLNSAIGNEYVIFGKVRVADVLSVAPNRNKSHWQRAFNKIKSKHFDFVICEKSDIAILAAIELDDKSHKANHREARDAFLVNTCAAVNLPLFRFAAKVSYSPQAIREHIMGTLNPIPACTIETPLEPAVANSAPIVTSPISSDTPQSEAKLNCPKCDLPMVLRTAKTGANAGKQFWACSGYPKCRSTIPF